MITGKEGNNFIVPGTIIQGNACVMVVVVDNSLKYRLDVAILLFLFFRHEGRKNYKGAHLFCSSY